MENTKLRIKKSQHMTKEEHNALIQFVQKSATKIDAAENLGLSRIVLDRVLYKKSGAPKTIDKILKALA